MKKLLKFFKKQKGQALLEYSIVLPGVVFVAMGSYALLGDGVRNTFCKIADTLNFPACAELSPDWGQPLAEEPPPDDEVCTVLQESEGASQCDQSPDCTVLPGLNNGTWSSLGDPIDNFVIKAGKNYFIYQSGITWDGCYYVNLDGPTVSWERQASGKNCKNISHSQSWFTPLCAPE